MQDDSALPKDVDQDDAAEDLVEPDQILTGLPTIDDLLRPILEVLADRERHPLPEVVERISDLLELDGEARGRRIPSGRTIIGNRTGWARTSLLKAGLVDQPEANIVVLTPPGADFIASHPGRIDGGVLARDCPSYANWLADRGDFSISERFREGTPAVWMVRAGERGAYAPQFVEHSAMMLGWGAVGDVAGKSREEIAAGVGHAWPDYSRVQRGQAANTLFRFAAEMRLEDVVITPEPSTRTLLLGKVSGEYCYLTLPIVSDYVHLRPVQWIARISRDELSYGARLSLMTQMTLSRSPHEAELLRLADLHATDSVPTPLTLRGRSAGPQMPADRVVIPRNARAPTRVTSEDLQTYPRRILQLLADLHGGQLALPDFQRSFVWAPEETRELIGLPGTSWFVTCATCTRTPSPPGAITRWS